MAEGHHYIRNYIKLSFRIRKDENHCSRHMAFKGGVHIRITYSFPRMHLSQVLSQVLSLEA